jgi:hypothetical protein
LVRPRDRHPAQQIRVDPRRDLEATRCGDARAYADEGGTPARFDYEYQRNGTANLSLLSPVSADDGIHQQKRSQLVASISASSMISTPSLAPWASKHTGSKRKQNSHHRRYNSLIANQILTLTVAGRYPSSVSTACATDAPGPARVDVPQGLGA